jgi:hypothetical protein
MLFGLLDIKVRARADAGIFLMKYGRCSTYALRRTAKIESFTKSSVRAELNRQRGREELDAKQAKWPRCQKQREKHIDSMEEL